MLHILFQRHHLLPHEVYNLPRGAKQFLYASMSLQLDMEEEENKKAERKRGKK